MKTKLNKLWITAIFIALVAVMGTPAFAGEPSDFIKEQSVEVTKLLRQKESKKRAEKFSKKINDVVDFELLASRALGEHWEKRTPEEQQEFLTLLQALLQENYRSQLEGRVLGEDYDIEYVEEKVRGDRAIVRTLVTWEEGKRPVEYKLEKKEAGNWVVYDIVIDDVSLEETYRESYTAIIEEEGWETLISRMKERLEELRAS